MEICPSRDTNRQLPPRWLFLSYAVCTMALYASAVTNNLCSAL